MKYICIYSIYYIIQLLSKNSTLSYGCDHNGLWQAYIMTLTVYQFNIEILDASCKIYIEYLYASEMSHFFPKLLRMIEKLSSITFCSILDGKFGYVTQNLHK